MFIFAHLPTAKALTLSSPSPALTASPGCLQRRQPHKTHRIARQLTVCLPRNVSRVLRCCYHPTPGQRTRTDAFYVLRSTPSAPYIHFSDTQSSPDSPRRQRVDRTFQLARPHRPRRPDHAPLHFSYVLPTARGHRWAVIRACRCLEQQSTVGYSAAARTATDAESTQACRRQTQ